MHYFDAVAFIKSLLRMSRPRHDGAIDLDGNPALAKSLACQQRCDGAVWFDLAYFAIELDMHALILARNGSRACGGATCDR